MKDEQDIELPGDDDENVGSGAPKKKKEKKKKTKEERMAGRRSVFWTLLVVVVISFVFWMLSTVKTVSIKIPSFKVGIPGVNLPRLELKRYVEYKL